MSKCRICNGINEEIINFGKIVLLKLFKNQKFKNIKIINFRKCKYVQIREILVRFIISKLLMGDGGV